MFQEAMWILHLRHTVKAHILLWHQAATLCLCLKKVICSSTTFGFEMQGLISPCQCPAKTIYPQASFPTARFREAHSHHPTTLPNPATHTS